MHCMSCDALEKIFQATGFIVLCSVCLLHNVAVGALGNLLSLCISAVVGGDFLVKSFSGVFQNHQ